MIRRERKDIYYLHNKIHVNYIAELNLLHDMSNPSKCVKSTNSCYSPILHGCINTHKGKTKFKNFRILFDSGCSPTIVVRVIT